MEPENYFLRYAMPCAFILKDLNEISDNELKELEDSAINNKIIPKKRLRRIFHRAFEKMEKYSDKFDIFTIREYFHQHHNKEIDNKEGYYADCGEMQRELSKIRIAEIIDKKDEIFVVKFNNQKRNVFSKLVPEANVGDKVYIHFFFAVEKV